MRTLAALFAFAALTLACKSARTPSPSELPPLRAPSEAVFCKEGVGTPPAPRTPQQVPDDVIKGLFKTREKELHSCYKERVKRGYAIQGHVGLRFIINPEGHPQDLCLVEDETGDADFLDCMFGELGTWQFPKAPEPTEVRKRFEYRLEGPS